YRVVLGVGHLFRSLQRVSRVLGFSRMGLVADDRSSRVASLSDWQSRSGSYSLRRHSSSSESTFPGPRIFSNRHNSSLARLVHGDYLVDHRCGRFAQSLTSLPLLRKWCWIKRREKSWH